MHLPFVRSTVRSLEISIVKIRRASLEDITKTVGFVSSEFFEALPGCGHLSRAAGDESRPRSLMEEPTQLRLTCWARVECDTLGIRFRPVALPLTS